MLLNNFSVVSLFSFCVIVASVYSYVITDNICLKVFKFTRLIFLQECPSSTLYADPCNCTFFWQCNGQNVVLVKCPPPSMFHEGWQTCLEPKAVDCTSNGLPLPNTCDASGVTSVTAPTTSESQPTTMSSGTDSPTMSHKCSQTLGFHESNVADIFNCIRYRNQNGALNNEVQFRLNLCTMLFTMLYYSLL